jgi:hypothetical protein
VHPYYLELKIIKYMGEKNLPNAEEFKHACINIGSYSDAVGARSMSYPSTL